MRGGGRYPEGGGGPHQRNVCYEFRNRGSCSRPNCRFLHDGAAAAGYAFDDSSASGRAAVSNDTAPPRSAPPPSTVSPEDGRRWLSNLDACRPEEALEWLGKPTAAGHIAALCRLCSSDQSVAAALLRFLSHPHFRRHPANRVQSPAAWHAVEGFDSLTERHRLALTAVVTEVVRSRSVITELLLLRSLLKPTVESRALLGTVFHILYVVRSWMTPAQLVDELGADVVTVLVAEEAQSELRQAQQVDDSWQLVVRDLTASLRVRGRILDHDDGRDIPTSKNGTPLSGGHPPATQEGEPPHRFVQEPRTVVGAANDPYRGIPTLPDAAELAAELQVASHRGGQLANGAVEMRPIPRRLHRPRPVVVSSPFQSWERHLGSLFHILRADNVGPVLDAIAEATTWLTRDQQQGNVPRRPAGLRLYENARVLAMAAGPWTEPAVVVHMTVPRNIQWEFSRRLNVGQVVVFLTAVAPPPAERDVRVRWIGAVAQREESQVAQGFVTFRILWQPDGTGAHHERLWQLVLSSESCTAVETDMVWDAYGPVADALQQLDDGKLPFRDVLSCNAPAPPRAAPPLTEDVTNRMRALRVSLTLDESQTAALDHVMRSSIAIVQGPPGTGKTYTGVAALRCLLLERDTDSPKPLRAESDFVVNDVETTGNTGRRAPPILVMCYTNHALDSFLHDLLEREPSLLENKGHLIRLGGRSKVPVMQQFSPWETAKASRRPMARVEPWWGAVQHKVQEILAEFDNPLFQPKVEGEAYPRSPYASAPSFHHPMLPPHVAMDDRRPIDQFQGQWQEKLCGRFDERERRLTEELGQCEQQLLNAKQEKAKAEKDCSSCRNLARGSNPQHPANSSLTCSVTCLSCASKIKQLIAAKAKCEARRQALFKERVAHFLNWCRGAVDPPRRVPAVEERRVMAGGDAEVDGETEELPSDFGRNELIVDRRIRLRGTTTRPTGSSSPWNRVRPHLSSMPPSGAPG